ncbi:MAG: hypothetical protein PHW72_02275 [Candidatus Pacebacteria bacterium]|nr:hypothetical protein [Candidatus Paceibacterota bacterium]
MKNKLDTKIQLKKIIKEDFFKKEIKLCQTLYQKKGKCAWGKCKSCGVVPFLYKLRGEFLEDPVKIKKIKERVFKLK